MTFNIAKLQLQKAYDQLNVSDDVKEILNQPLETLEASLPVRMDDGSLKIFKAYRVHYNNQLGPTKGGIRFHPQVDKDEVTSLAFWMTFKTALLNLPYGGGKGGIIVNPKELSNKELERLSRAYVRAFFDFMGPDKDVPAPDVYTNATIMGWMYDEYSQIARKNTPAFITGKPISLGGSLGRETATSTGAYYCIKELVKANNLDESNLKVAVQGFGNAGYHIARLLHDDGYKIVAVSDSKGGIYAKDGLDPVSVLKHKKEHGFVNAVHCTGSVCQNVEHQKLKTKELLEVECDILIPAALENQITKENANNIKASIICEVANGPIKPEADTILESKNITIIPDILANAGGVTVSYFEWVQNRQGLAWTADEVNERLKQRMQTSFEETYNQSKTSNVSMRTAAYMLALNRISEAIESKGSVNYFKE